MGLDHGISVRVSLPDFALQGSQLEAYAKVAQGIKELLDLGEHTEELGVVKVSLDAITLRKAYHISDYMHKVTRIGENYEATFDVEELDGLREFCLTEGNDDEWLEIQNEICLKGIERIRAITEKYPMYDLIYWQSY